MNQPLLVNHISQFSGIFYFDPQLSKQDSPNLSDRYCFEEGFLQASFTSVDITDEFIVLAVLGKSNERELRSHFPAEETCASLIRQAFIRWGIKFTDHLSGEFSAVVWERKRRQLWVIRDRFGFIPFYYIFQPNSFFCFSDRISALSKFKKDTTAIDAQKLQHYLAPPTSYQPFNERTFYRNVKAALPGHVLHTQGTNISHHVYWSLNPGQYQHQKEEDIIEHFRELFFASIEHKIEGYKNVGAHLSGGMDSSSIACVTGQFRDSIATFYVNPGLESTDESYFANSVVQKIHSRHFEVSPRKNMLEAITQLTALFDRPDHFVTASGFLMAGADQAQAIGCDLMLTGHDGDSVVGHGNLLIDGYWNAKDWNNLKWALQAYATTRDLRLIDADWLQLSADEQLKRYHENYFNKELWKILKKKDIGDFFNTAQRINHEVGFSYSAFLRYVLDALLLKLRNRPMGTLLTDNTLSSLAETSSNAGALYQNIDNDYLFQFRAITNQSYIDAIEQMYHMGLHYRHHYAHPFFDEKLVELSLAIPESIKFGDGKGRDTIRRALKGILPEEVRTRGFKTSFNEYGLLSFKDLYTQTQDMFTKNHSLWQWVDHAKFLKLKDHIFNPKIPLFNKLKYSSSANRILYLGIWLDHLKNREE